MESNTKSRFIILIILEIIFALAPIIITNLSFLKGTNYKSSDFSNGINTEIKNLKLSNVSGKIYINDNNPSYNWSVAKSAGICTGNGTYSNPYIINDLEIDGGDSGSCIVIENSFIYFRIENCILYNTGSYPKAGIRFSNVSNSQLINNNCSNNHSGIMLEKSYNNTILRNTINNNGNGISIDKYSNNNNVTGNTALNNYNGIIISFYSSNNNITENTLRFNQYSIELESSNNNTILGNTINNNGIYGISLLGSNNNTILGNIVRYNYWRGIFLAFSDSNTILGNEIKDNDEGIYLYDSNYNKISENTIHNNNVGIIISNCKSNEISNNNFSNNGKDIVYCGFNELFPPIIMILGSLILIPIGITGMMFLEKKMFRDRIEDRPPIYGITALIFDIIGFIFLAIFFRPSFSDPNSFNISYVIPFTIVGLICGFLGYKIKKDTKTNLARAGLYLGIILFAIIIWPLDFLIAYYSAGDC